MKRLLILLFVLAAEPLLACTVNTFQITPARPTTTDEIQVVATGGCPDGCIPSAPQVRIDGSTITIQTDLAGACILIPQPWGERVDLGRLPAGTYDVVFRFGDRELTRQPLVVRAPAFEVTPSFGSEGTQVILEDRDPGRCQAFPCAFPEVLFGDVPATVIDATPEGYLVVVVPPHAPGLVDVTIKPAEGPSKTASQVFLYPQPQADLGAEYRRFLFPTVFEGPGAHGSQWTTENLVNNRGFVAAGLLPLGTVPIAGRVRLPNAARDGGAFLYVPRGLEPSLAFASHFADRSRRATDAGTEMRVVHEDETGPRPMILNVPLTEESRQTLRIYDFDAVAGRPVTVSVFVEGRPRVTTLTATLEHSIVCVTTPCYPEHPTYAVINLDAIQELRGAGVADIQIFGRTNEAPLWGFVSVTNNDTQHVTTYSPQQ